VELVVELEEVAGVQEVDEAVADVALVLGVAGQVEKVVGVGEDLIDFLGELFDRVFVGDISDHDGGPRIILHIVDFDGEGGALLELLEAVVLAVVEVVVLALLVAHVVVGVHVDGARVALLEGVDRPDLAADRGVELLGGLRGLLVREVPLAPDV
jgi:hypothetical protein